MLKLAGRRAAAALVGLAVLVSASCSKKKGPAHVETLPARAGEQGRTAQGREPVPWSGRFPTIYVERHVGECDILVSAFEPFVGETFSSSWEAVRPLDGQAIRGKKVRVIVLPIAWGEMSKKLTGAIQAARPEIAIGFGMGTRKVRIELAAWNERRAYEDNLGKLPPINVIEEGGPEELHTTLPVNEIAAALARQKIKFVLSTDPGGYLCNEAFYTYMRHPAKCAGFIHVPDVRPGSPELEELKRAARAIVEACVESAAD